MVVASDDRVLITAVSMVFGALETSTSGTVQDRS